MVQYVELDSANKITSRFVYTFGENVPEYFVKSDTVYRVIADHLGSVSQVVNTQTGTIVQKVDYDEYGNVTYDSNPSFQPFAYGGGLYDTQTKLVRFGARDYNAEIGRWTIKDQTRFESGTTNLFVYCEADPINNKDFDGNDAQGVLFEMTQAIFALAVMDVASAGVHAAGAFVEAVSSGGDLSVNFRRYPRAGGGGIAIRENGQRVIGIDFHRIGKKLKLYLPHIDSDVFDFHHIPWNIFKNFQRR